MRSTNSETVENLFFRAISFLDKQDKSRLLTGAGGFGNLSTGLRGFGYPHLANDFPIVALCEGMGDYFAAEYLLQANEKCLPIGASNADALLKWAHWFEHIHYKGTVIIIYQLDNNREGLPSTTEIGQKKAIEALKVLRNSGINSYPFRWTAYLTNTTTHPQEIKDLADSIQQEAIKRECGEGHLSEIFQYLPDLARRFMKQERKNYLKAVENMEHEIDAQVKGEPNIAAFEPNTLKLNTFRRKIPERTYLFYNTGAFGIKEGFLPSGVTCIMAAPGGCGKTYLLMQAAIAAASGGNWLYAKADQPMKVLFLAAEEEQDEIERRAQIVAKAMGLLDEGNEELLNLTEQNLRIFGRLGENERLMDEEGNPREIFNQLKFFLEKNPDIKLVILDPASDYMSKEAEKDSAAAKDWAKLLSQLTLTAGRPTVLVAHHTRKDSSVASIFKTNEKDKIPDLNADDIRGSGGIVNSFRWAMILSRREYDDKTEKIFIRVVKTNYTKPSGVLQFEPDKEHGGLLKFKKISSSFNSTNSSIQDEHKSTKPIIDSSGFLMDEICD